MPWSGQYAAAALPADDGWTRTASAAPSTEEITGGQLHIAQGASKNIYYDKTEGSPTTYATHHFIASARRVSGGAGRNDVAIQLRAKGRFMTQVSITSATNMLIETYTGSSWTSDNVTITDLGSAMHVVEVLFSSGALTFKCDGSTVHTYSGTQNTGQTENRVFFGDIDAGSSSASESYWDNVEWIFDGSKLTKTYTADAMIAGPIDRTYTADAGVRGEVEKTYTADAVIENGTRTLDKILRGEAANNNLRVYGGTDGEAYRLYDSGGSTVASAVVTSGVAEMTNPGTVSGGRLVGFTDNTYATSLEGRWWRGDFQEGNVFEALPSRLGFVPLSTEASYYYPTSQYGGRAQICESDDYQFILYRTGGMGSSLGGTDGNVVVVRRNKATGLIDQGPVTVRSGVDEGHEVFCIARAPDGELRFVYGGQNAAVYMRISSAADDVTSWGTATQILAAQFAFAGSFAIDSNGRNHIAGAMYSGGALKYGTSTDADPTNFTWTTLVNETGLTSNGWGVLFGDMAVYESGGTVTVGVAWGMYKKDGTWPTNYRYAYYAQTANNGSTWTKAGGSSITLPMSTNISTGAVAAADEISTAYHYAAWTHLAFLSGAVPHVLVDNGTDEATTYCTIRYWNGSAWASNTTNIPMWESGITDYANWGVLLTSDDDTRLYLYAANGYPIDPSADTKDGFQLVRQTSTDHFATYSTYLIADGDTYPPLSYTELADTGSDFNTDQTGICYPKVSNGSPRTVLFSAVDKDYATVFLASLSIADYTADAVIKTTQAYTADSVVITRPSQTYTADAVVVNSVATQTSRTFTADAVVTTVAVTTTKTFTSDAVVETAAPEEPPPNPSSPATERRKRARRYFGRGGEW